MKIKILLINLFLITLANGQTFTRTFPITPSTGDSYSLGSCAPIVQTPDGGYILNYSYGYPGIHDGPIYSEIIKTDASFVPIWKKQLSGGNGKKTFTFNDGSTLFFENPTMSTYTFSFSLEKFDANGQSLWLKSNYINNPDKITIYDAVSDGTTIKLAGAKETNAGQFFGYTSNAVILDSDSNGNIIQAISLSDPAITYGSIENICKEPSGNYYVIIKSLSSRFIAKLSSANAVLWCKKIDFINPNTYLLEANASLTLNNGDLLIGGRYNYYSISMTTFYLLRLTSNGNLVWSKTINNYTSAITGIQELPSNEIIASGLIRENGQFQSNAIILKLDANGNSIWAKKHSPAFSASPLYQKTATDWYFSAFSPSFTNNHPILFNTDNSGNSLCNTEDVSLNFINNPITLTPLSLTASPITLAIPSTQTSGLPDNQSYVDNCLPLSTKKFQYKNKVILYPNPSSDGIVNIVSESKVIDVKIHNILGQRISEMKPDQLEFSIKIDVPNIYFITINTENEIRTMKVVIKK